MYYILTNHGIAAFKIKHKYQGDIYLTFIEDICDTSYLYDYPFEHYQMDSGDFCWRISQKRFQELMGWRIFKSKEDALTMKTNREYIASVLEDL